MKEFVESTKGLSFHPTVKFAGESPQTAAEVPPEDKKVSFTVENSKLISNKMFHKNIASLKSFTSLTPKTSPKAKSKRYKYTLGKAAKKLALLHATKELGNKELSLQMKNSLAKNIVHPLSFSKEISEKVLQPLVDKVNIARIINSFQPVEEKIPAPVAQKQDPEGPKKGAFAKFLRDKMDQAPPHPGTSIYPTKSQLIKSVKFGKPDRDHAFDSEKVFETVSVFLFKSGFLAASDTVNLKACRVDLEILENMIRWSHNVDFSPLRQTTDRYRVQENISDNRMHLLAACAIHYDLHIPSVIRYLGGEYIGQHLEVSTTIDCLRRHDCPETIINDLERVLTKGCPAKLVADDTRKNFSDY